MDEKRRKRPILMKQADREIIEQLNRIYDAQAAGGGASFASLTGSPEDNAALGSALDAKQSEAEVQAIADAKVESEAYGPDWNGDTTHAPAKNDVYDKIEAVVSSIPPAHSGGVIGTAVITIDNGDAVTVDHADGVFAGASVASFVYDSSSGQLVVTTILPTGANPFPHISWESTASLTASLHTISDGTFIVVFLNSTTGLSAGTAVDVVRIAILKLSQ